MGMFYMYTPTTHPPTSGDFLCRDNQHHPLPLYLPGVEGLVLILSIRFKVLKHYSILPTFMTLRDSPILDFSSPVFHKLG